MYIQKEIHQLCPAMDSGFGINVFHMGLDRVFTHMQLPSNHQEIRTDAVVYRRAMSETSDKPSSEVSSANTFSTHYTICFYLSNQICASLSPMRYYHFL